MRSNKMSSKTFRIWQRYLVVIIAAIAAVSVIIGNAYILLSAVVIGLIVLIILRRRVTEIVSDERTYAIAYKAARLSMSIVGVGMAVIGATLLAFSRDDLSAPLAQVGFALEYATCGLLMIHLAAYTYYSRKLGGKE
jgi:uncharacterized membrane protein